MHKLVRIIATVVLLGVVLLSIRETSRAEDAAHPMKPTRVLFTGDSITGWSDLSKYLKFSHIIECMIEARYGAGKFTMLNRGKGGDSTAALLARFQTDVLDAKPDIVVLLIGGNDAGQKVPRETTTANLDRILTELKAVCPRVLLLQYHVLPWPDKPEKAWSQLDDNNDLIAAAAKQRSCPVLDMAPVMRSAVDDTVPAGETNFRRLTSWQGVQRYRTCDLVAEDGVHLMFGGELVYARAIFAKLAELKWLDR